VKREIILDTETTGLDPSDGHRIVEIGCVELLSSVQSGKFFHSYVNPERNMPQEAERVHGITSAFLSDKPVFASVVSDFLDFIADDTLIIHNAAFDMRFINAELARLGFPPIPLERAVDTVAMARKKFPGSPASLDALCKRFEIDLSARTKHGALLDAELLADVYLELLGGKQVALTLDRAGGDKNSDAPAASRPKLEARTFVPAPEELAAHADMLKLLKKPVWAED
jgi:DNA polymerase-3 subunit epsilon